MPILKHHLHQHFYSKQATLSTPNGTPGRTLTTSTPQQIVVKMDPPKFDALQAAWLNGAEAQRIRQETTVPSGTTYSKRQLANIMGFCGLGSDDKDLLPTIWEDLQSAKGW